MPKTNNERLQAIAEAMQDLNERLVYVGGAMAGSYATDPIAIEPRTTIDVDCVVNSTSYREHAAFEGFVCFGNHDFYGYYDLATVPDGYCKQIRHNVHAYYNSVVHLDDTDVVVSTLWSHIEPYDAYLTEHRVSDFYRIRYNGHRLSADTFNQEHKRCFRFVKQAVEESSARTKIVLTHHVPTQLCTAEEFRDSNINGAFTVELGDYIADSDIDYWIYGHSHRNIDAQIGKTKITSNQLGYISHGEYLTNGFDAKKMIEV